MLLSARLVPIRGHLGESFGPMPYGNARFGLGCSKRRSNESDSSLSSANASAGIAALAAVRRLANAIHALPLKYQTPRFDNPNSGDVTSRVDLTGRAAEYLALRSDASQRRAVSASSAIRVCVASGPKPLENDDRGFRDPEPQDPAKDSTNQPMRLCFAVTSPIVGR